METELVSAREAKTLMPLLDERHFVGALYDPIEGHVDPYGVTQAYAKAARLQGAEIYLRTRVPDLSQRSDGGWAVATDHGDRKSAVSGKSVPVSVDLGGRRLINKKHTLP